MTATQTRQEQRPDTVVWVDERHAIVARTGDVGGISTTEIRRAARSELRYLADIVHEIGSREHVMIVGPSTPTLALEREYVAISHRPDRIIAPPIGARGAGAEIIGRFERLAA